jgi:hypothetical protein
MKFLKTKSIYYEDVNLIAQPTSLLSRSNVPKELHRIIVSPMEAVVGKVFAKEAFNIGLSVAIHRFCSIENQVETFNYTKEYKDLDSHSNKIWCAIGLNELQRYENLYNAGCRHFIIDVANGYLSSVMDFLKILKNDYIHKNATFMVGNVHSEDGLNIYRHFNGLHVRVGIGQGSGCTTKDQTGYTRGQITELSECYHGRLGSQWIVADGGIKNGGDAAKAFGCGADYVMLGGYFAKTHEAQNVIDEDYEFWGSASKKQMQRTGKVRDHSEGRTYQINKEELVSLKEKVDELWSCISSAVSYSGFKSLQEFVGRGVYEIKQR